MVQSAAIYFFAILGLAVFVVGARALIKGFYEGLAKNLGSFVGVTPPKPVEPTPPPVAEPSSHPCAILHAFVPISVREVYQHDQPHTVLLLNCHKCGSHLTALYLGSWTIEEFLKTESDASREIRRLEGMLK